MKVPNIFISIAKSKWGQKFYKNICNPDKQGLYTRRLLTAETIASTASYMYFTQKQDKIDDTSKLAMQIQHVLSCIASIAICTPINVKINKGSEKIAKMLDPKIVDVHKCKAGLNILLPLMVVTFVNRCFLPAILTPFSSVIRDKLKESKRA